MHTNRTVIGLWLALSAVIAFMLIATNPEVIGLPGIGVFFIATYFWWFVLIQLAVRLLPFNFVKKLRSAPHFTMSALLAGVPTYLLALQSLGQLSNRDVVLMAVLSIAVIFYWSRRSTN